MSQAAKDSARSGPLMIIGPVSSGKSSLLAALSMGPSEVRKTESMTYNEAKSIDTPGEMLAIPRLYNALILNSARASVVLMVMPGDRPILLPAKISLALKAPVLGVITKMDLADAATAGKAARSLSLAGVKKIFSISLVTGQGLTELRDYLSVTTLPPPSPAGGDAE
ncbi:MAG: EutP/PduV family microcompartment system protein [Deltaproteobacteria bacterium]|jgi:ethanolamine utilization protein EutP|nr:EutP/PduV family microcompartment system protein [Deltaproteobacteria bacterium]